MNLNDCINLLNALLEKQNKNKTNSHTEQLLYERGYLIGLLARLMVDDANIANTIIKKYKKLK